MAWWHRMVVAGLLAGAAGCLSELPEGRPGAADGGTADAATAPTFQAWPADGTWGVPPELPLMAVRRSGSSGGPLRVRVEGPAGSLPAAVHERPCEELGFDPGRCAAIEPTEPLHPWAPHRVLVLAPDGTVTWGSRFATGPAGAAPPLQWLSLPCAIDERAAGPGCLLPSERGVVLRVRASGPARLWLVAPGATDQAIAPRGEAALRLRDLPSDATIEASLRAADLAGHEQSLRLAIATTPPLAPLSITEVRADALGPEPGQEYVEVVNYGAVPLDLQGYALSDAPDAEGDVVPEPAVVPAGARVLLVPDAFDGSHPDDPPVPPGVLLVRMGSSLGSGGLSNSGEPLFLRDPEGHRVSAAPALAPPAAGACLVRRSADGRTGAPEAFAFDPTGGCTPGAADRLP